MPTPATASPPPALLAASQIALPWALSHPSTASKTAHAWVETPVGEPHTVRPSGRNSQLDTWGSHGVGAPTFTLLSPNLGATPRLASCPAGGPRLPTLLALAEAVPTT